MRSQRRDEVGSRGGRLKAALRSPGSKTWTCQAASASENVDRALTLYRRVTWLCSGEWKGMKISLITCPVTLIVGKATEVSLPPSCISRTH